MTLTDVSEVRDPLGGVGERALRNVVRAGEDLLVHVLLACLAQRGEGGGVAAALGQAVPAVAELVRTRRQPPITSVAARRSCRGDHLNFGERDPVAAVELQLGRLPGRLPADDAS